MVEDYLVKVRQVKLLGQGKAEKKQPWLGLGKDHTFG